MSRALLIVEEFLQSNEQQLRKNALTALAAIDTPDSARRLARVAFADPDPNVRARAAQELGSLSEPSQRVALQVMSDALSEPVAQEAFRVLAQLYGAGLPVGSLAIPFVAKVRLSWASRPTWRAGFAGMLGAIGYCTLGTVTGAALLSLFLARLEIDTSAISKFFAIALLITPFAATLAALRLGSATSYPAQGVGALVEAVAISARFLPFGLLAFVSEGELSFESVVLGILPVATAASARLGAFLACGSATRGKLSFLLPTLSGLAAATLASTVIMLIGGTALHADHSELWLYALAVSAGLVVVFVRRDYPESARLVVARWRLPTSVALVGVAVLGWLWLSWPMPPSESKLIDASETQQRLEVSGVPFRQEIQLTEKRFVTFYVVEEVENGRAAGDFTLRLSPNTPGALGQRVDDPPCFNGTLEPGKYEVVVNFSLSPDDSLVPLNQVLAGRVRRGATPSFVNLLPTPVHLNVTIRSWSPSPTSTAPTNCAAIVQ